MSGSKNRKPKPPTLEVEIKLGRLTMRGEGKAIIVMPVIALIYSRGLAAFLSGLAWLVGEVRALIG